MEIKGKSLRIGEQNQIFSFNNLSSENDMPYVLKPYIHYFFNFIFVIKMAQAIDFFVLWIYPTGSTISLNFCFLEWWDYVLSVFLWFRF